MPGSAAQAAADRRERFLSSLRHALPRGRTLPEDVCRRRHRTLLALLWAHAIALPAFGIVRGYGLAHSVGEGLALAVIAALAMLLSRRKRMAAALVSFGLITSSAILVHLWDGVIEAHFHFFVMIVLLSLYEDWLPFSVAAAYVVIHHGAIGTLYPDSVYNHADAIAHPWRWAVIHGSFVTAAGVGCVAAWRLNENVRAQTRAAYRRARESEERFRSAFENAPIGMTLTSVGPADAGRLVQVNRAMCEITGYARDELVRKSFEDITHPDDVDTSRAVFDALRNGDLPSAQTEKRYLRPDGAEVSVSVNISLARDSAGQPVYAIAQVQDITERKRAEQQLHHQARHDALTGLPNRRKLTEDLESSLALASIHRPLVLVLFDLDGFKAYNDAFGHPAGDALLSRLARGLAEAVTGSGVAYRMGGDEFCVLAPLGVDGAESLALAAKRGLTEHGEGFEITASYGSVLIPLEASNASEALRIADNRMYGRKGTGRSSAARQTTDALLRALTERIPQLSSQANRVTELSEAVGRALGLPVERLAPLLQAAALHDVGKVAIPDALLRKPAPLDDLEWEFVRTHTAIGERILSAAPSLSRAAKIVRSTHERFDGQGYPDGLAREEIPLEARIIAVCDAYDAMTSGRAYRTSASMEGALSELRRKSGTQFDPAVIDAFVAVMTDPDRMPIAASRGAA